MSTILVITVLTLTGLGLKVGAGADPKANDQGWEFAHRFSERIARYLRKK